MTTNISENILLTGAGFTANFNGFLAESMWAEIFNHSEIQNRKKIKNMMVNVFDYETVYHKVINGESQGLDKFDDGDKEAIKKAVYNAYGKLDDLIKNYNIHLIDNLDFAVRKLFGFFAGDRDTVGVFFTLNQDIFVERYYHSSTEKPLRLPGPEIPVIPRPAVSNKKSYDLTSQDFITLKGIGEIDNFSIDALSNKELNYIKLHGSFNWESSDGSRMMVIGVDKQSQITKEPLLDLYYDLFRKILSLPERKLYIIGYGFRDKHVNEIIAESINKHGLNLIVISPQSPRNFIENLKKNSADYPFGDSIIKGLLCYYPYNLANLIEGDTLRFLRSV